MDHNEFMIEEDLVEPFTVFLKKLGHLVGTVDTDKVSTQVQPSEEEKTESEASSTKPEAPGLSLPKPKEADLSPKADDHYEIRYNFNLRTHCSKIDESFVDYILDSNRGCFSMYFDQALYKPPQIVLSLEAELERQVRDEK